MRASAVEAAKFVGTHVRRVAPTAAAWAHRHCAPALCLKPVLNWGMFLREASWKYSAKLVGS